LNSGTRSHVSAKELVPLTFLLIKPIIINKNIHAGRWWLTTAILAAWEAEIRRITVYENPPP
jgi:hypothetical protein